MLGQDGHLVRPIHVLGRQGGNLPGAGTRGPEDTQEQPELGGRGGQELAQFVGASRETVNKALSEFANRGWLRIEGRSVVLLSKERLARRAR